MRDFSGVPTPKSYTLQDLVYTLTIRSGARTNATQDVRLIKAIQSAIRALHPKHKWSYYHRQSRFNTSPQVPMEITYDKTGGSSERLVTITSADTWPDDAIQGELKVGDVYYRIHQRLSSTTATLAPGMELSADYTGKATWQRRAYQFGREIRKVHYMHNLTTDKPLAMLPPMEFDATSHGSFSSGSLRYYSWQNHGNRFGSSEIILYPTPIDTNTVEVSAEVFPHIPTIKGTTGVDMATTSGSTTVTSAAASFNSSLVGSVIRIGRDATVPTESNSEEYTHEAFVLSVDSPTSLTISEAPADTLTGLGYLISSPIDIEASVMLEALEDEAYYQYCKNHNHQQLQTASSMAQKSLVEAMVRNERTEISSYASGQHWDHPFGISGVVQVDNSDA